MHEEVSNYYTTIKNILNIIKYYIVEYYKNIRILHVVIIYINSCV